MNVQALPAENQSVFARWVARQEYASSEAAKLLNETGRAQLHWFCGTGKTRVAAMVGQKVRAKRICVVAPTLTVLFQHMEEFRRIIPDTPFHAFCGIKDLSEGDDAIDYTSSLDRDAAREFVQGESFVLFTTYLSLSEAALLMTGPLNLCIFDEAHRTAGKKDKRYGFGLTAGLKTQARLFLTATPIFLNDEDADENFSMEDSALYGAVADRFPYREAQSMGLLCDYKIVVSDLGIEARKLSIEDRFCLMAAELIAMMEKYGLKKAITCHRNIEEAVQFQKILQDIAVDCAVLHINGNQSHANQTEQLDLFKAARYSIMTQVRCMNEGVNVPSVDLVYFANPKSSDVSILQAIGRALRMDSSRPGKVAVLGLPLHGSDGEEFWKLRKVLQSLRFADQRVEGWLDRSKQIVDERQRKDTPNWIEIRAADPEKWRRLSQRAVGRTIQSTSPSDIIYTYQYFGGVLTHTRLKTLWDELIHEDWRKVPLCDPAHPMLEPLRECIQMHERRQKENTRKFRNREKSLFEMKRHLGAWPFRSLLDRMQQRGMDLETLSNVTGIEFRSLLEIAKSFRFPTETERASIANVLKTSPDRICLSTSKGGEHQSKEFWLRRQIFNQNTNMRAILLSVGAHPNKSVYRVAETPTLFEKVSGVLGSYNPTTESRQIFDEQSLRADDKAVFEEYEPYDDQWDVVIAGARNNLAEYDGYSGAAVMRKLFDHFFISQRGNMVTDLPLTVVLALANIIMPGATNGEWENWQEGTPKWNRAFILFFGSKQTLARIVADKGTARNTKGPRFSTAEYPGWVDAQDPEKLRDGVALFFNVLHRTWSQFGAEYPHLLGKSEPGFLLSRSIALPDTEPKPQHE